MGGVVKKVKKIIPKEIRPAVPFAAAYFGGPALGAKLGIQSQLGQQIAGKALTAALASKAQGDDTSAALRSAALAASPDILSGGLGKLSTTAAKAGIEGASPALTDTAGKLLRASRAIEGAGALKTIGAQSAIEGSAQLAEIQQDQIDAYNRQLQEQGVMNKVKRRQGIFDIYMNAGYDADYVNSVLDKYGYADGGIAYLANGGLGEQAEEMLMRLSRGYKGAKKPLTAMFGKKKKKKKESVDIEPNERDEITVNIEGSEGDDGFLQSLQTAREGIEMAYKPPVGSVQAQPMMKFARGGEVEIEEEAGDLGIMDLMKDQGIEYGEQVSAPNNFAELNMLAIDLFGRPYDQLTDGEQETLMDFVGSKSQAGGEGIMQMASGYKSDIEEMYEQYVFEMEEMGLQPMSFSEFLARERAGMADGGDVPEYDVEGETMEGRMMEDFIREGMDKGKQENKKRFFEDYEQYRRRRNTKEKGIEVANGGIISMADGGIMEKDMRGGGFIPEGSKERADDVPARLSKNEFVMTADAVRAAGGGSVNKGAKRMYDLMYSLEGKI